MNKFLNLVMRFITADQIFSGKVFFPSHTVLVLDDKNTISDITSLDSIEKSNVEHFKGIITPGFINTHCHLELSHLKTIGSWISMQILIGLVCCQIKILIFFSVLEVDIHL